MPAEPVGWWRWPARPPLRAAWPSACSGRSGRRSPSAARTTAIRRPWSTGSRVISLTVAFASLAPGMLALGTLAEPTTWFRTAARAIAVGGLVAAVGNLLDNALQVRSGDADLGARRRRPCSPRSSRSASRSLAEPPRALVRVPVLTVSGSRRSRSAADCSCSRCGAGSRSACRALSLDPPIGVIAGRLPGCQDGRGRCRPAKRWSRAEVADARRRTRRGGRLGQLGAHEVADRARVGLALRLLHHLTDEEAEQPFLAAAVTPRPGRGSRR